LVCTDLSNEADEVIASAEILRQRVNGELDVLHVSDIDLQLGQARSSVSDETFYEVFVGNISRDLKEKLQKQVKRTGAKGKTIFHQGDVVESINLLLIEGDKKYDLLVIGHNSKKGLFKHLMGSTARKMVASAAIPTLVVKAPMAFGKIAGLIDDSKPANWMITSTFDFFRSLAFKEVEFITLWAEHSETFKEAASTLAENVSYFKRDNEDPIIRVESTSDFKLSDHLTRIIEEDHVDLAVMKRNRGKKLNKMIIGSETMRMLETGAVNLLVLPV
jgi:nucleotide-binding universal stress UspA family protein